MSKYETKDSGKRIIYPTGAQRDISPNKPKYGHLTQSEWEDIGAGELDVSSKGEVYTGLDSDVVVGPVMQYVIDPPTRIGVSLGGSVDVNEGFKPWLISDLLINRLQALLERGAAKYFAWNWLKGIPLVVSFNSAIRHIIQWRLGDKSEDHLAAAVANLMFIMDIEDAINKGDLPEELITDCGVLRSKDNGLNE